MKRVITSIIALLAVGTLCAQEEQETTGGTDTTRFRLGGMQVIIVGNDTNYYEVDDEEMGEDDPEKPYRGDGHNDDLTYWGGFEVGINLPMNADFQNSFESNHLQLDPSQSFVYNFNFAERRFPIIKDYFGIVTGLGFTNSRYGLKDPNMRLAASSDSTFGVVDTTLFNGFSKNQLRVNSFHIPVLFQINTSRNSNKNFHLAFGAIGGVRFGSNVKYKFDVAGGGDSKIKEKGRYNLNAFQLQGTVRMGFNDFGLFANYNILSLYEENKSEVAYPFSFGASFHF